MTVGKYSGIRASASAFVRFVLLPNLPFAIARPFIWLDRPYVEIDYLALGIAAPFLPKRLNLALFATLFTADIFFSLVRAYHFLVGEAVYALVETVHVNRIVAVSVLCAGLAVVAVVSIAHRRAIHMRAISSGEWYSVLLCVLVLVAATIWQHNLFVGSVALKAYESRADFHPLQIANGQLWQAKSATSDLKNTLTAQGCTRENIVLVVVESMGYIEDNALRAGVETALKPLADSGRYRITSGRVPFNGSTVAAEFRELCGLSQGFRLKDVADNSFYNRCLPATLHQCGYRTVAVHGFLQRMFERNRWYVPMQFDKRIFAEQMPESEGYHYCGTQLRGVCDSEAARVVHRELLDSPDTPKLVYWLTLSTHIDIGELFRNSDVLGGCSERNKSLPDDVCGMVAGYHKLLDSIVEIAKDPKIGPTRFIIVGDHSPAFLLRNKRELFSRTEVPYFQFEPIQSTSGPHVSRIAATQR